VAAVRSLLATARPRSAARHERVEPDQAAALVDADRADHVARRLRMLLPRYLAGRGPMSSETTVRCDRCDEVITADRTVLRVESGPLRGRREQVDLCDECAQALVAWLRPGDNR
jgi:hypothetical protein